MKKRFEAELAGLRRRVGRLGDAPWIVAFTIVLVALGGLVGAAARERAAAIDEQTRRLRSAAAVAGTWIGSWVPPTPAESAAWLESRDAVRDLAVLPSFQVAVTEIIARSAEQAGLAGVQVRSESSDTISFEPLQGPDARYELSPVALRVEVLADPSASAEFVRLLPPQVDVRRLEFQSLPRGEITTLLLIMLSATETAADEE